MYKFYICKLFKHNFIQKNHKDNNNGGPCKIIHIIFSVVYKWRAILHFLQTFVKLELKILFVFC